MYSGGVVLVDSTKDAIKMECRFTWLEVYRAACCQIDCKVPAGMHIPSLYPGRTRQFQLAGFERCGGGSQTGSSRGATTAAHYRDYRHARPLSVRACPDDVSVDRVSEASLACKHRDQCRKQFTVGSTYEHAMHRGTGSDIKGETPSLQTNAAEGDAQTTLQDVLHLVVQQAYPFQWFHDIRSLLQTSRTVAAATLVGCAGQLRVSLNVERDKVIHDHSIAWISHHGWSIGHLCIFAELDERAAASLVAALHTAAAASGSRKASDALTGHLERQRSTCNVILGQLPELHELSHLDLQSSCKLSQSAAVAAVLHLTGLKDVRLKGESV